MASSFTRTTIIAVFPDEQTANSVARQLADSGIPRENIHIGSSNNWASNAATGGAGLTGNAPEHHSGGFMHWLESLFGGGDEHDSDRKNYSEAVRRGNCVVAVNADDADHDRVTEVMEENGAVNVHDDATNQNQGGYSAAGTGGSGYDPAMARGNQYDAANAGTPIPVVKEEMEVGKRAVAKGGVRVYTHTVEQPVEEQVTLRDEQVRVNRRPVDRPLNEIPEAQLRDQVIEVVETTEEPVVRKRARVVEEVSIQKNATERTETVRDTLRNQEVQVEQLGEQSGYAAGQARPDAEFQRDFETRYAGSGDPYTTYQPAYDYGYRSAGDSRYGGRSFDDAEEDLRTDYLRNNPNSSWDRVRGAVRYGWERMTGKR